MRKWGCSNEGLLLIMRYGYFARLNDANDALYSARQSFVLAIIELIFLLLKKSLGKDNILVDSPKISKQYHGSTIWTNYFSRSPTFEVVLTCDDDTVITLSTIDFKNICDYCTGCCFVIHIVKDTKCAWFNILPILRSSWKPRLILLQVLNWIIENFNKILFENLPRQ